MKTQYLLLVSALFLVSLSSCSTYKNTTTPDDVYYSPGQPVQTTVTQPNNSDYYSTPNENYVKMKVQNPDKWSYFDDYNYDYYGYSPYSYGSAMTMGMSVGFATGPCYGGFGYYSPMSYYNSYYAWNNFYNPYYGGVVIVNGKNTTTPGYTRMSNFNPSAYRGSYYNARPTGTHFSSANTSSTRSSQTYYNSHSNNSNSNMYRSSDSRPSYTPATRSSNSTFSSGGGGGGGASRSGGFSRPSR